MSHATRPGRFSRRVVLHEEPAVVAEVERLAIERGRSVGAEIRAAIREHLAEEPPREVQVR
jgi:hypothetical protein